MQPTDDLPLLREYAATSADAAFAALVERPINLVYSVAFRLVSNPHQAEEITQAVFIILAQKASSLRHEPALGSWLFQTTRLTARNFIRGETRRHRREEEARMQSLLNEPAADAEAAWAHIAPLLDTAIAGLNDADRRAIVLRFFENRTLGEVGVVLGANEDAARMRVNRAMEKLRRFFAKRGVSSTAAILAGAMSAHAVQAAPAGLARSVAVMAAAKGAAAGGSTLTLVQGALKIMAWTKQKMAVGVGVGLLLVAGTTTISVKGIQTRRMYAWRAKGISRTDMQQLDRWPAQVWIAPAKNLHLGNQLGKSNTGRLMGRNMPFSWLLRDAYGMSQHRMIFETDKPPGMYDFMANPPEISAEALQKEISGIFSVVVLKRESVKTNGLILRVGNHGIQGLEEPTTNKRGATAKSSKDTTTWFNQPRSTLDVFPEDFFSDVR